MINFDLNHLALCIEAGELEIIEESQELQELLASGELDELIELVPCYCRDYLLELIGRN